MLTETSLSQEKRGYLHGSIFVSISAFNVKMYLLMAYCSFCIGHLLVLIITWQKFKDNEINLAMATNWSSNIRLVSCSTLFLLLCSSVASLCRSNFVNVDICYVLHHQVIGFCIVEKLLKLGYLSPIQRFWFFNFLC